MTTKLVERLSDMGSEQSDRQGFLAKAGAATLAALVGAVVIDPTPAQAWGEDHGCVLCDNPYAGACGTITCWWCWWGNPHRNGYCTNCHQTQCCEAFNVVGSCGSTCGGYQICSRYGASRDAGGCGPC